MQVIELDYAPYDYQSAIHLADNRYKLIVGGRRVRKKQDGFNGINKALLRST
jgi:hypothetical protein